MKKANVIFILDGTDSIIECTTEDIMKIICQKYSNKIEKEFKNLNFLYEGKQINYELSFKEQANSIDRKNNKMKILVNNTEKVGNDIDLNNKKLLENIKAIYFIKIIFNHLDENVKLKTIKYNRKLQNILNVNLINYKFLSGRYIIYDSKGKGKEYLGIIEYLLFEGEYKNGIRNGNGNIIMMVL